MKFAVILLPVIFLIILNESTAITIHSTNAHHSLPPHRVVKHVISHKDGHAAHGDVKKDSNHAAHKQLKSLEKSTKHDEEERKKGEKLVTRHKIQDAEHGGKKSSSHAGDSHQSHKKSEAHTAHGAKSKSGAGHKKTNYSKGFREQYHKNEHKKQDVFYSNGHKMGDYKIYGGKKSKYQTHVAAQNHHGKHGAKSSADKYGKNGKKIDEHKFSSHNGFKAVKGQDKFQVKHNKWGKKSGNNHHDVIKEPGYLPLK